MIRKIITPKDNNLIIKIPNEYIGKEIEYIVFPINDSKIEQSKKVDIDSIGGILNKYADISKMELEDKAWELHVLDKFGKW